MHKNETRTKVEERKNPAAIGFYKTRECRELRYKILLSQGRKCCICGTTPDKGAVLHVDHIMPVSGYPELKLAERNLQVLCEECNIGKSNKDTTDWRGLV